MPFAWQQVDVEYATPFGSKGFAAVLPDASVFHAFTTRQRQVPAGELDVEFSSDVDGRTITDTARLEYPAHAC